VDPTDTAAFEKAITPKTRVLYTETLGNPTLKIADIRALSKLAKRQHGLSLVVDNTFTPMMISPARLGADVVVYSMTKYINGASDLVAGAICTTKASGPPADGSPYRPGHAAGPHHGSAHGLRHHPAPAPSGLAHA
jgi:methionine-gamma-lyase